MDGKGLAKPQALFSFAGVQHYGLGHRKRGVIISE